MKLIFENMAVNDLNVNIIIDMTDVNVRTIIKAFTQYPDMLKCCAVNLAHYEKLGGTSAAPDVLITDEVQEVLKRFNLTKF